MLQKTKAIILHQIKYTDSGIITQVYTRNLGRQSIMIKGMRSRKSGKHNVLFQPASILELVFYYRESRSVQMLKEFSVSYLPAEIYSNVKKSCMAVFLSEILSAVLKEESPNYELYDFIQDSIIYLDKCESEYYNFHIAFLAGLSSYLGFEPLKRKDSLDIYFDMLNGNFVPIPPPHSSFADRHISEILARFFDSSFENMRNIALTGSLRDEVLDAIIKYFNIHLPGLKKINSLEVLKEIFR
jgi:DNA repair protein RecO (recombination protein O)